MGASQEWNLSPRDCWSSELHPPNFCSCFLYLAEPPTEISKLVSRHKVVPEHSTLIFRGWVGLCSSWNLMALTIVLGGFYVQHIISPQQEHLLVLVESRNSILMRRETKRKGMKEKLVSKKIDRKILGEKREWEKHCRQQKESEGEKWGSGRTEWNAEIQK